MPVVTEKHNLVRTLLHLALDETQEMFLVHASRVVNVGVNLANIVKVSVGDFLAVRSLLILVEEGVKIEFAFEILKSTECETLAWSV